MSSAAVFGTVPREVIAWWRLAIESGTGSEDKTGLLVALWLSAVGSGGLAIGPWRADGINKRRGVLPGRVAGLGCAGGAGAGVAARSERALIGLNAVTKVCI